MTSIETCKACSLGKYSDAGGGQVAESVCRVCPIGKYTNDTGTTSCRLCPPGKNLVELGQADSHDELSDCTDCPVLQFSPFEGHGEKCYLCLTARTTGTFKESVNDTDICTACPIGFYSDKQNLKVCYECPLGYFANTIESNDKKLRFDRCESCPRGTFGAQLKATRLEKGCQNCTRGKYSELEAVNTENKCKGCPQGKWSSDVGVKKESECTDCATGRYGLETKGASSKSSCSECSRGRFLGKVGSFGLDSLDSCQGCPIGYAQKSTGQAFCLPCTPGTFASEDGVSECEKCIAGRASAGVARSSKCDDCDAGRYTNSFRVRLAA